MEHISEPHTKRTKITAHARPVRIDRYGSAASMAVVTLIGQNHTIEAEITPDGALRLPHGFTPTPRLRAELEAAAHRAFLAELESLFEARAAVLAKEAAL